MENNANANATSNNSGTPPVVPSINDIIGAQAGVAPVVPAGTPSVEGGAAPTGTPQPPTNGGTDNKGGDNSPAGTPPGNEGGTGAGDNNTSSPQTFEELITVFLQDNLDAEQTEARSNLLDTFKASKLDANGNLLNDVGEVVLSAAKLKAYVEEDTLPLNTKGDVVNEKGEVLITKAELDKKNSVVLPIKSAIEANFGITFPDNLVLDESEDSLLTLVDAAVKIKSQKSVIDFLESNPDVKSYYQHLALGGDPNKYSSTNINYKDINVKNLSEQAKLDILNRSFSMQGTPSKDNLINLIKKEGDETLNTAVGEAIKYLDTKQKEYNAGQETALQQQYEAQQKDLVTYWTAVDSRVKEGKIGDIVIPIAERTAFFDYLSKPADENNNSADGIDSEQDSLDFQLLVSYLRFKKGDVSKLAAIKAKEQRVANLLDKFNKNKLGSGNGVPRTDASRNNNGKGGGVPSLDILL